MEFKDKLNEYIELINCSAQYLSSKSGISSATISRYRSGERIPEAGSEALSKLSHSIASIAKEIGLLDITSDSVLDALSSYAKDNAADAEILRVNLNKLISLLSISISDLSKSMNYDSSYISRIKTGQRKPSNPQEFIEKISFYVVKKYSSHKSKLLISTLMNCDVNQLTDESNYYTLVSQWLNSNNSLNDNSLTAFLKKLDDFDLNTYIRTIHFDELKVPTVPFQLPTSKTYYGLAEIKNAELDWLKATVLSKSMEDIILYSDLPVEEMAQDLDFMKKWMFGMAMLLKKGLHLNQIHCINRSFNEMMLGLEAWIPMYMTGQISPYYIKGTQNTVFNHCIKSSGTTAISGEAISGKVNSGKYYLTKIKEEVEYYRARGKALIAKASPLMEIYRQDSENDYRAFFHSVIQHSVGRRSIHSSLPLYTISNELLDEILKSNNVSEVDSKKIFEYYNRQVPLFLDLIKSVDVNDEIPIIEKDEYNKFPMNLSLSDIFYEKDILYTYEQYIKHLELTQQFANNHPKYTIQQSTSPAFRNIRVIIQPGQWVLISKSKSPAIHFVIQHPKMREALEQYIPPIVD